MVSTPTVQLQVPGLFVNADLAMRATHLTDVN